MKDTRKTNSRIQGFGCYSSSKNFNNRIIILANLTKPDRNDLYSSPNEQSMTNKHMA